MREAVKDDRLFQHRLDVLEIRATKLVPFGDDNKTVSALQGFVAVATKRECRLISIGATGFVHRCRIVSLYFRTLREKQVHHRSAWRLPHVIRVGFKRKSPERKYSSLQPTAEVTREFIEKHALLPLIDRFDTFDYRSGIACLVRGMNEGGRQRGQVVSTST